MTQAPDFETLLEALARTGVRYVLIGGVAMRLHGSSQVTDDLDVLYSRDVDNLEALARALETYHPRLRGAPDDLPFRWDARTLRAGMNFTLMTDIGAVDLLGQAPGAGNFEALLAGATHLQVGELDVPVASLEHLISMKRAADRPKDRLHLMELEALRLLRGEPE